MWTKEVLISLSASFLHLFSSQFIEFFNNQLKFVLAIRRMSTKTLEDIDPERLRTGLVL